MRRGTAQSERKVNNVLVDCTEVKNLIVHSQMVLEWMKVMCSKVVFEQGVGKIIFHIQKCYILALMTVGTK